MPFFLAVNIKIPGPAMPYITYNGQTYEITQAQFDSYTVGAAPPAGATNLTAGLANDLNLLVPAGGTVLNNDTATTPILTPNTTNTSPGQTLTEEQARAQFGATFDPGPGLTAQGYAAAQETAFQAYYQTLVNQQNSGLLPSTLSGILTPAVTNAAPLNDTPAGGIVTLTATPAVTNAAPLNDTPAGGIGYITDTQTGGLDTINAAATAIDPATTLSPGETIVSATNVNSNATAVDATAGSGVTTSNLTANTTNTGTGTSADSASASANIQGLIQNAQNQQTIADQRKQINNGDWRVRLRLAPQAKYLYNAPNPGILKPLQVTDGIIFPYTPAISTSYRAQYTPYDLTHSNYRGYWYQNSYVNEIQLTATFTAQDTNDANYLLAVIHFLRSATKMFYGQDAERGTPPPLVYLSGFGDYQFREHACAISNFNYVLPADVDYIRAGSPNNAGLNFNNIRDRQSVATNSIFNSINRLAAAFLTKGAITSTAAPPTLGLNRPTYVPTKMEIQLTLLPVQSRQQVSKQFSLKEFANGNLLKGGFW